MAASVPRDESISAAPTRADTTAGENPSHAATPFQQHALPVAPIVLDHYEVLAEIKRGGMGVVYKARDTVLGRIVALKTIRSGALASREEVERFYREAKAVAQLKHPNIIGVFDFGQVHDQLYFTMALASHGSLADHLDRLRQDSKAAVALLEKVARAVQCVHENGLFHRDLKPGNILLEDGDVPLVSDFGLAKAVGDADEALTRTGEAPGTPAYMAPEQAAGQNHRVSAQTDIWALGVILYEMLCGCRPFTGPGRDAITSAILSTDPPRPRSLQPQLGPDLETIILKCLEKDPAARYPSAGALADDLGCWLRDEPIKARPLGRLTRLRRWAWRRPRRIAMAAALLLVVATGLTALHFLDPDRPLNADILPRLQRQQPVMLVGPQGPPPWSLWRLPGTSGLAPDGAFSLHSGTLSLMELVPDPQMERYRYRAEVRQDALAGNGDVGIYIGYSMHEVGTNQVHCFLALRFADWGNKAQDAKTGAPVARVLLTAFHRFDPQAGSDIKRTADLGIALPIVPLYLNKATGWRTLTVEVTPEAIDLFWGSGNLRAKIGTLTRETRLKRAQLLLLKRPDMAGANPEFALRGGLGLYVHQSSASFRNVVIEPLDR